MFLVLSGTASGLSEDEMTGAEVEYAVFGVGDVVDPTTMLDPGMRPFTARASSDLHVVELSQDDFRRLQRLPPAPVGQCPQEPGAHPGPSTGHRQHHVPATRRANSGAILMSITQHHPGGVSPSSFPVSPPRGRWTTWTCWETWTRPCRPRRKRLRRRPTSPSWPRPRANGELVVRLRGYHMLQGPMEPSVSRVDYDVSADGKNDYGEVRASFGTSYENDMVRMAASGWLEQGNQDDTYSSNVGIWQDTDRRRNFLEINELYMTLLGGGVDLTLGKRVIRNGLSPAYSPGDRISSVDLNDPLDPRRLGTWQARAGGRGHGRVLDGGRAARVPAPQDPQPRVALGSPTRAPPWTIRPCTRPPTAASATSTRPCLRNLYFFESLIYGGSGVVDWVREHHLRPLRRDPGAESAGHRGIRQARRHEPGGHRGLRPGAYQRGRFRPPGLGLSRPGPLSRAARGPGRERARRASGGSSIPR